MPQARLNQTNVQTLKCPKGLGRETYFDTAKASPPGFALRVTNAGGRSYALKFYVKGSGARGWEILGDADAINLDDARKKATAKWSLAQGGKDPRFLAATNKARTIEAVCKDYIEAVKAKASATTVAGYERLLLHVQRAPELKAPLHAIEDSHVSTMLRRLGKQRGPYLANRVFALISASLRWARGTRKSTRRLQPPSAEQRIDRNPVAEMTALFAEQKRDRALSNDELVRLWRGLDSEPAEVAAFVRFIALTGLRRNETVRLRWRDLNRGERTLTVPGETRKGGHAHVVFLAPLALELLDSVKAGKGDASIFGVGGERFLTNESRLMRRLRQATDVDFVLHDLRRTAATGCAKTGADLPTISRVLGHRVFSGALPVTVQYVSHQYAGETRAALERWARYVEGLLGVRRPAEKVSRMRPRSRSA